MASEFYVAEDGTIHRHPVTVANNTGNRTNTYAPAPAVANAQTRTEYRAIHQVSEGRIVCFWIISIVVAILIAIGVRQGYGADIYGADEGFVSTIGSFVIYAGALAGSFLYGISYAESVNYNLWAYILSALSSVGGIITAVIAVAAFYWIMKILFYVLVIWFVIAVICGILGGS